MGPFYKNIKYSVPENRRRYSCRGMAFRVDKSVAGGSPVRILEALGLSPAGEQEAHQQLLELIEERASRLDQFPNVAPVASCREKEDEEFPDLLTTVTVITKSSNKVFIKSKRPLLSRLRKRADIVLLFPKVKEN